MKTTSNALKVRIERCRDQLDWLVLGLAAALFAVGGFFTATVIGAILGIPLLLMALPLLVKPHRNRVCGSTRRLSSRGAT